MGVVKNLMVRVGADLSGLVSGFSKAGNATGNFQKKAAKDISGLKDSLSQMKGAFTSIREATADVDLTKSVSKQVKDTNKELASLQQKADSLWDDLSWQQAKAPTDKKWAQELSNEIVSIDGQIESVYHKLRRLEEVKSIGESVGMADVDFSKLNKLQDNIASLEEELRQAEDAENDAADAAKNLGTSAKSSGSKIKTASSQISNLRKHSKSSSMSVSDLARSLKRVGVVAAGIKLASSVLGRFRSLVSSYISQNDTLQAKVDELKAGFGQALAPAINVAANALSKLMPYVLGVSNAIGELITNLFGSGWTTIAEEANAAATATDSATAAQNKYNRTLAGFDQINKLGSSDSSTSGSTSGSTVTTTPAEIALPTWLTDLPTRLKEAFDSGDYKGVGAALAEALSSGLNSANESDSSLGKTIANVIQGGIDAVSGFVADLDWASLGTAVKTNIEDLFTGIDWKSVFQTLGATAGGIGTALWSAISDAVTAAGDYFNAEIEAAGGNVIEGIWNGILKSIANVGTWIKDNIFTPFIEGFKTTFDIHSPSQNEEIVSLGSNIIGGILNGVISGLTNIGSWIKENVFTPISNALTDAFSGGFSLQSLLDLGGSAVSVGVKLFKSGWSSLSSFVGSSLSVATNLVKKGWTSLSSFIGSSLSIKTNLTKGWTGSIAKALGIESIASKLNLSLPEISINWKTVNVLGKDFKYPTGFNIKWNAKGAILDGAQLFGMVGNTFLGGGEGGGREALLPLDRNDGWKDEIGDRVAAKVHSGNTSPQNLTIYLELDGKVITKTVVKNINSQAKATGKNPLAACM